jgi:NADPH:quinone reductase-like Zn-dependent oxidoreductase
MRACGVADLEGDVQLLELPEPPAPARGQVLVAVEAAGIGPWDGLPGTGAWDVGLRPPAALGVEGAGRIVAAGEGVGDLSVGDVVLAHEAPLPGGSGFWAERILLTADHAAVAPPELGVLDAGALPVAGLTARQALDALGVRPGERLLITGGAGTTGALAVQLAVRAGAEVTATASPRNAERLRRLGAAAVVDYHDPDWPEHAGGGFDAALTAAPGTAAEALALVRDGGRLCSLTGHAPPGDRGIESADLYVTPDAAQLAGLAGLVAAGELRLEVEPVALADAPGALERVAAGRAGGAKLVISPAGEA